MSTQTKKARTPAPKRIDSFRRAVRKYYKEHGRHDLPWRKTRDPYRILVSEIMLQQTQVPRVLEKYTSFLKRFPTVRALARAPLSAVLKEWSGLGYNRRGKYLHDAANMIVSVYGSDLKKATTGHLPGVGPYTRSAVRTFAFNEPHMMIETNIRAVFIHHFFADVTQVNDRDLVPLIEKAAEGQDPRAWYWALMDYGSHLKKLHVNPTRRSAHYAMQSKFAGSLREVRGAIMKMLNSEGAHGDLAIARKLEFEERFIRQALAGLKKDGLITGAKGSWQVA